MELTGGSFPVVPEAELYRSIQAVLPRETEGVQSPACSNKGMLRWTLHKKVQNNPVNSLSLVQVLIKELEKAERWDSRKCIIPLLHTLMYAIIQAAYIPDDLYKRVYDFCKRLLTYPQPYCSVGLSYTRQIKTERLVPGLMYQRMLTAEQRLKNEHYPVQERVFVLADPEVFSGSLIPALFDEASAGLNRLDHMCNVVQHTIQASLGAEQCHGLKLAHVLKGQDIEPYFQEVQAVLEQMAEEGSKREGGALRSQIQQLYREIFSHADSEPLCGGPLCDCPLPNPEMSFHLWTEDLDIWRELTKWFRSSNTLEQFSSFCEDEDDFDFGDPLSTMIKVDMPRFSILSSDSGIEKDLLPGDDTFSVSSLDIISPSHSGEPSNDRDFGRLSRRNCMKVKSTVESGRLIQETLEDSISQAEGGGGDERRGSTLLRRTGANSINVLKQQKPYTARIVIMGDDRVVGRLTKAYYLLKKREARRLYLTNKVSLQFYYIPVCTAQSRCSSVENPPSESTGDSCSLGSYLSNVDPWYDCNIKSLDPVIHKLAKMQPMNTGRSKDPFISDVISYYVRCGQQPVYFNIFFVKISFTREAKEAVEDVFVTHLEMEFPEFRHFIESIKGDKPKKFSAEFCGAVISINYKKVTLSGRDVEKGQSVRTSRAQISAIPSSEAEDLNCLTLTLNEVCLKNKSSVVKSKIRSNNIKIRTLESRSFTVTLDKDSRRIYKDVQSVEISPCLDPGYVAHRTKRPKLDPDDQEAGLSKYMKKTLLLPINTFAGIIN